MLEGYIPPTRRYMPRPFEGEHVHALRSREHGCFLVVQNSMGGKNSVNNHAGSLNTFGRNEIEVAPISSALLRIACLVRLFKTCRASQSQSWLLPLILVLYAATLFAQSFVALH